MPSFQNPLSRPSLPFRHEGSPLRHVRDGDAVGREWQKSQKDSIALQSQGNALQRLQRQVARLQEPKFVMDRWHPFKIYNVPAAFCSSPEDSWRTFRVRAGLVGWRSMFGLATLNSYNEQVVEGYTGSDQVGLAVGFDVPTDPVNGYQSDLIIPFSQYISADAIEVPSTGTAGVTATTDFMGEFLLNETQDNNNERWAEFWIEINDPNDESNDNLTIYGEIRCRMFQFGSGTRPGLLTPTVNQIPLGVVCVRRGADAAPLLNSPPIGYRVEQYVYDHMLRRYPIGYYNASLDMDDDYRFSTGGMIYRGEWDKDETPTWTDTIFYDMMFYPGDVLSVVYTPADTFRSLLVYQFSPTNNVGEPPLDGSTSYWKQMFRTEYGT